MQRGLHHQAFNKHSGLKDIGVRLSGHVRTSPHFFCKLDSATGYMCISCVCCVCVWARAPAPCFHPQLKGQHPPQPQKPDSALRFKTPKNGQRPPVREYPLQKSFSYKTIPQPSAQVAQVLLCTPLLFGSFLLVI